METIVIGGVCLAAVVGAYFFVKNRKKDVRLVAKPKHAMADSRSKFFDPLAEPYDFDDAVESVSVMEDTAGLFEEVVEPMDDNFVEGIEQATADIVSSFEKSAVTSENSIEKVIDTDNLSTDNNDSKIVEAVDSMRASSFMDTSSPSESSGSSYSSNSNDVGSSSLDSFSSDS